jgi:hypothetical protein
MKMEKWAGKSYFGIGKALEWLWLIALVGGFLKLGFAPLCACRALQVFDYLVGAVDIHVITDCKRTANQKTETYHIRNPIDVPFLFTSLLYH